MRAVEEEADLERLAAALNDSGADVGATSVGLVDWRRQAEETVWLLAERDGEPVGAAVALVGWHDSAPPFEKRGSTRTSRFPTG